MHFLVNLGWTLNNLTMSVASHPQPSPGLESAASSVTRRPSRPVTVALALGSLVLLVMTGANQAHGQPRLAPSRWSDRLSGGGAWEAAGRTARRDGAQLSPSVTMWSRVGSDGAHSVALRKDSAPPPTGFAKLGRPFVINLERRTDRMVSFMETAAHVGITNVTVVRGVPHECGALGLAIAHITALQQCWASPWVDSCLIMEDDFAVRLPPDNATALIDSFLRDVQLWDVLMLSCNLQQQANHDARGHWCPSYAMRVMRAMSTAGYAVKRTYAPTIVNAFLGAIEKLKDECEKYFAIDVAWHDIQPRDVWYVFHDADLKRSMLGFQRASVSDIVGTHTDYGVR